MSWEDVIYHCRVEKTGKKEITIYFVNGKYQDGFIILGGKSLRYNIPFQPYYLAAKYNLKEYSEQELFTDIQQRFNNWLNNI